MSKASPTFQDASERLELVFNAVAEIARGCDLDTARLLLVALQSDDERYGKIIAESLDKLAAVSDGPIKWKHGRGVSAIARCPKMVYPHVWSSAHEAAFRLSRLALELFDSPESLTKRRRKALAMTTDEVADYQERIRRERAKMIEPATDKPAAKGKTSLDARATALKVEDPTRTKTDIAKILGLTHTQSLTPRRCPMLDKAMRAHKARTGVRGYYDNGKLEAIDPDDD